jgi:deazaflavin-dependent oxidoreductase (nitroreductase family)
MSTKTSTDLNESAGGAQSERRAEQLAPTGDGGDGLPAKHAEPADCRDERTVEMSAPLLSSIGSTRAGVWLIGNLISPFQRWVIRTTRGRVTLTGKPVLLLTAIGRRSGQPRTLPLMYLRDDGNLIVCNVRPPWERRNPWPLNVRANPEVTIRIRGVAERRIARNARPEEIERLWPRLVALWPPYERFFARTHERAVFVLEVPASKHA